ncbi:MAG TPA: AAA family ATPase [Myxococcota bacterium]|nr:AAA family ATPase [Myxococcota bacterium]
MLRITLLGGLTVTRSEPGPAVALRTRKTRALLGYLACPAGRAHPRDKLAALLWGDCTDRQAQTNLRQALYGLRKALAPVEPQALRAVEDAVSLEPARVEVDALRFEHLVSEGTPAALAAAVALYQGELLEGLAIEAPAFEEWLLGERERLRERAIEAMARLLTHQRTAGAFEAAVQTGIRLLTVEPAQESVHRVVIRLQLRLGRRGAALRQYRTCIDTLQRELGIEPEAETKQLYQEILRAVSAPAKTTGIDAPSSATAGETRLNLPSPTESPHLARTLARMPFVGRRKELERLMGKLGVTRSGTGGVAFLVGEPGIGKTRLLEEFSAQAGAAGARVLSGRCFEGELSRPFGPFAEALAGYAKESDTEALRDVVGSFGGIVAKIVPELRERLPDLPEPVALAPEEERYRLLDAVAQVLWVLARRAPLVVVLDDLHWADGSTLVLMRYLARFMSRHPALLLCAYRDVELDRQHPLGETLVALRREVELERIGLSGLPQEAVTGLFETIAQREVPANFVEAITAETGGNPFFLREVLLHLLEEGKLESEAGRFASRFSIEEMGIPESVRQVIGRRLSRLSEEANRLLTTASGCSGSFRFEVAAAVAGLEEQSALDALDSVLETQLLRTTGDPEVYDFTHALIRHTLYGELNPARQVRLHRSLAEEMERRYGGKAAERALEIAQQWHRSAVLPGAERGVVHCLIAADRAEQSAAHEEAVTALRMALDLMPAIDARRPRLLARLGLMLAWSLKSEEAVRVASEAGEFLAACEGSDAAADYLAEAAEALWLAAQTPRAWELATQGLRHTSGQRNLTWARLIDFELQRRSALDPESLGMPVDSPEVRELSGIIRASGGRVEVSSGSTYTYLAFESRRAVLDLTTSSPARLAFQAGEYRQALDLYRSAVAKALERGELALASMALANGARLHLALGEFAAADDWYGRALPLGERVGNRPFIALQLLGYPFERAAMHGEGFEQLAGLTAAAGTGALENRRLRATVGAGSAYTSALLGNASDAQTLLSRIERAIDLTPGWAVNYLFLIYWSAYAVWELDLARYAPLLERNLRQKPLAADFRYPSTDARLVLAWMCALQSRHDEASQWFERAREVLDQQAARPLRAIVDFEEARMYIRRADSGDRDRARRLLEAARGPFESIGMPGWLRKADELRKQLER